MDNYRVGIEAGEALGAYATANWEGKVDWVIGLDLPEAGQLVQSRITGAFEGVRAGHPELPVEAFVRIDGRGMRDGCGFPCSPLVPCSIRPFTSFGTACWVIRPPFR